jgi:hypothetical protein
VTNPNSQSGDPVKMLHAARRVDAALHDLERLHSTVTHQAELLPSAYSGDADGPAALLQNLLGEWLADFAATNGRLNDLKDALGGHAADTSHQEMKGRINQISQINQPPGHGHGHH